MNNIDVRIAIKKANVYGYQVAAVLGISETSFSRKLRKELSDEEKKQIFDAIDRLTKGEC